MVLVMYDICCVDLKARKLSMMAWHTSLLSSLPRASKQTANTLDPTTPTRVTQSTKARLIPSACIYQYGAAKEARQPRECVLQSWCTGKVNKQTLPTHVRATNDLRRKTGITLEERARDEHGIEAISGIFSSPAKSPPKRGSEMTGSESMDIQESMWASANRLARMF